MRRLAGRYAIVQFIPYPETGEFANIGVVLACPKKGYFDFKLQTKKYARYTHFFKDLDRNVYLKAVQAFKLELKRVEAIVAANPTENNIRETFNFLLHPRDAIIRLGDERGCLFETPEKKLNELYKHYVEHGFVNQEYFEHNLERNVQQIVDGLNLRHPFKKDTLGAEDFTVKFPLVQLINGNPTKIIKPFYLGQAETNLIYDHADRWIMKLRRLRKRNQLPEDVLFTVAGPEEDIDNKYDLRIKAFDEVCHNLQELAEVANDKDKNTIIAFAARH